MKVVVVDDSSIVRERVTEMLRELLLVEEITHAIGGLAALDVIAHVLPDLVVLDIHMPNPDGEIGINGIDVLKRIKSIHNPPCVIMLSNFSEPQYRTRCRQLGADAFLDKSIEFFQLASIAKELLNKRYIA